MEDEITANLHYLWWGLLVLILVIMGYLIWTWRKTKPDGQMVHHNTLHSYRDLVIAEDENQAIEQLTDWYGKSPPEVIEHNEALIANDRGWALGGSPGVANKLIPHPTIQCKWNGVGGHGLRLAVWRRDMTNPECRSCYVEDPMT